MSSTHTITLLKPDGTGSFTGKPEAWDFDLQTEDPGSGTLTYSVSYATLTSAYENGKITYSRNAGSAQTLFVGKILKVERVQDKGKQVIRIQCIDLKAAMDTALAGQGSSYFITSSTETLAVTNGGLDNDGIPVSDDGFYRYFPDADTTNSSPSSSSAWIAIDSTDYAAQALCDSTITAGATEIPTQSTSDQGFPPRGIIWISNNYTSANEYVWYDGYAPDPSNSDKYTFWNCVRGVLSTTAASHFINHKIGYRAVKPINLDAPGTVEGYDGSNWQTLHRGLWRVNSELGCFDFHGDLTAAPYSYTDFRYSATHYDVDNASAETLETLVADLLEYAKANGGMGLTATTEYTIDWPRIFLLEDVGNTEPVYLREMLDTLIRQYEPYAITGKGLGYWYNPTNGIFELETYAQAGSADVDLSSVKPEKIVEKYNTSSNYSSVLVPYTPTTANMSLLSADRAWHPAIGDSLGGTTVTGLTYSFGDSANAAGWNKDSSSSGNNVWSSLMLDGNKDTGAGMYFSSNPSTSVIYYFWFPDNAVYEIGTVVFLVDLRNWLVNNAEVRIRVIGYDTYTPGTPPTLGTAYDVTGIYVNNGSVAPEASAAALGGFSGNPEGIV